MYGRHGRDAQKSEHLLIASPSSIGVSQTATLADGQSSSINET